MYVADSQPNATRRGACEPAPTVKFGHAMNEVVWVVDRRTNSKAPGHRAGAPMVPTVPVPISEPAPTLTAKSGGQWVVRPVWTADRLATTVQGDPRIWPPGHKVNSSDEARLGSDEARERYCDRAGTDSVKVTVAEASVLQSFRPDYPWAGSRTKQYEQIGNAVPPLLATHVLAAVTGASSASEVAA